MAVRLAELGHSVAIVDKSSRSFRRLPTEWPGIKVVGSGFDRDALDAAGAPNASALAAVTSGDNSNILTARIARETYEVPRVVARIYDPRRAEIYQRLGIPTVATVSWTIDRVLQRMLPEAVAAEWTDPSGRLMLLEELIPDSWAGQQVSDLVEQAKGRLVALSRAGEPRLDARSLLGQEGDVLHIAVMKDDVPELVRRLGHPARARGDAMTQDAVQ
jgi:trk system potassium uptake protein TrkA